MKKKNAGVQSHRIFTDKAYDESIQDIAVKHGLILGRDDPMSGVLTKRS